MKGLDFLNDYKKIVPVFMGVLLVGSIYGRVNASIKDEHTFNDYLASARQYREEKIYATSKEEYDKAMDMKPSLSLYCEIQEMLEEEGNPSRIESWCEKLIDRYPNEAVGYEHIIAHYKDTKEYRKCFQQYEIVKKRGIKSEKIEDVVASVRYEYKLDKRAFDKVSDFVAGYATYEKEGKYGLISAEGDVIFKSNKNRYVNMSASDGEYVAVTDEDGESYFIDLNGDRRFNFPSEYEIHRIGRMYKDLFPVYTSQHVYYYSASEGVQKLGPYDDGGAFGSSVAAVKEGDKWYVINAEGEKLTEGYAGFYMNSADCIVSNNRVFADTGEGYIMLDENLQPVSKTLYEDVKAFADDTYAAVKKDGKWGFIDNSGNFVIKPTFEDANSFCKGLAPAYESGLWGYIDTNGRWAIEPTFKEAGPLSSEGCGFIMEDGDIAWSVIKFIEFNY